MKYLNDYIMPFKNITKASSMCLLEGFRFVEQVRRVHIMTLLDKIVNLF